MLLVAMLWILCFQTFYFTVKGSIDINLIHSYFDEKFINYASIFGCLTANEQVSLSKYFILKRNLRLSIFNIINEDIKHALKTNHVHIGVVADGDCPGSEGFLIECGNQKFFDVKHHWLVISSSINVTEKFRNVTLNVNADVQLAILNNRNDHDAETDNWKIVDIYNVASRHGGVLHFTTIGFYNENKGYNARVQQAKYWIRRNMTGVTFKTMVVLPVDFQGKLQDYLDSDADRNVNTFNRFHARLIHFCRDYYNFTMETSVTKSWGYTRPDGSFDGMVGALNHSEIDFGSSPLFVRTDRAQVMEYGRNTWILRAEFIFRNPKSGTSIEIFLKPLSTTIWLITGLLGILSVIILKCVTTYETEKYHSNTETSWSLAALFTLGAFCQQGAPTTPKISCGRIATITIFLLSVIIYQFYSASIVSTLLAKPATVIKSIKDILLSPLKAGCEDVLYDKDYFLHTTDEVAKQLYYKKIFGKSNNSNFLPADKGLQLVADGGYAFHVEVATAYPIIETTFGEKAICELREVQLFRTQYMHANYQKHSPFRDMIDTCLQRIAEHGMLFRERRHWHPRKPECIPSSRSVTFNVGLEEFYPALMVVFIGIVSSVMILIAERLMVKTERKKRGHPKERRPFAFVH